MTEPVYDNVLDELVQLKMQRVAAAKLERKPSEVRELALASRGATKSFRLRQALIRPGINIIAEVKRASPSLGVIRERVDPVSTALEYEAHAAAAVSVLTEEDRFKGSLEDLIAVRSATALPLIRKDFIFDEYQIFEAALAGADAILLIVASLEDSKLRTLREIAEVELGLDALVEVHSRVEARRAVETGATLIGVNNRNLKTFEVSLEVSFEIAPDLPEECIAISESGLRTRDELLSLSDAGFRGFLVGESLMRSGNPGAKLDELLGKNKGREVLGI